MQTWDKPFLTQARSSRVKISAWPCPHSTEVGSDGSAFAAEGETVGDVVMFGGVLDTYVGMHSRLALSERRNFAGWCTLLRIRARKAVIISVGLGFAVEGEGGLL